MSFRDRKRSGDLIGYIIMGLVTLVCISIAYFFFSNESKKKDDLSDAYLQGIYFIDTIT